MKNESLSPFDSLKRQYDNLKIEYDRLREIEVENAKILNKVNKINTGLQSQINSKRYRLLNKLLYPFDKIRWKR